MELGYRKLSVYLNAKEPVIKVYQSLEKFHRTEQYALCDQLRRAAVFVPSNLAEGFSRYSEKEKSHFMEISFGSLMEVQCQLDIAKDLQHITTLEFENLGLLIQEEVKILAGMRKFLISH